MKDKKIKNMVLLSSAESSCARRRVEEVVEVDRVAGVLDERALRTDSCRLAVSAWQSCVTAGTVQQAGQLDKMVQEWERIERKLTTFYRLGASRERSRVAGRDRPGCSRRAGLGIDAEWVCGARCACALFSW